MIKRIMAPNGFGTRLGEQYPEPGVTYQENPYLIKEGGAYYNPLTGEAAYVDDPVKERERLIRRWYYVPHGFDIKAATHIIRQRILADKAAPVRAGKTNYVIFTTTACNAACAYCFEKGMKGLAMSEKTAQDVAQYIEKTRRKNTALTLKWFGGEPLCNARAIDIICDYLAKKDIPFRSEITTNGDLLDRITDDKLLHRWRTRQIQLTFDDVGENYGAIKGLDAGAFDRLQKTVKYLAERGIRMTLRVHYHADKGIAPCIRVVDAFRGIRNVSMYGRIIYETERLEDYKNLLALEDYMEQAGVFAHGFPKRGAGTHCMGDNRRVACITPDGSLSPCEHYAYGEVYGSIYSRNVDGKMLAGWQRREKHERDCGNCPLYPSCEKIINCPAEGDCTKGYREYQIEGIRRALRNGIKRITVTETKTIQNSTDPQKVCGVC